MTISQTTNDPTTRALMTAALDTAWTAVCLARAPSAADRVDMAAAIMTAGAAGERDFVRLQQKAIDAFCEPEAIAFEAPAPIKAVDRRQRMRLVAGTDHARTSRACELH
jgi:hypothetical protein